MNKTEIEWSDRTWNPVSGCSHVSEGCRNCYAERFFPRVYGSDGVPYAKNPNQTLDPSRNEHFRKRRFTDVICHPERLDQPLKLRRSQRIFVNSMSDLFHEDVSRSFIDAVWSTMAEAKRHTFQILTKRPARMLKFMKDRENKGWKADWSNIWLGVSVEDQPTADARIPILLQTPAAVRFISCEPMLGPMNILWALTGTACADCADWGENEDGPCNHTDPDYTFRHDALDNAEHAARPTGAGLAEIGSVTVDWVICGGESGPKARPMHVEWVRSIRDQCQSANVPFFFKQWGAWAPSENFVLIKESLPWAPNNYQGMVKIGKKKAGSLLDGREWKEFPHEK